MARPARRSAIASPFLHSVELHQERIDEGEHPFTVPALCRGLPLQFTTPVTFLVGENGSGKSTLVEGIGWALGFSAQGGGRTNRYDEGADGHALGRALKLSWRKRVTDGFFLRAETFFNYARYLAAHDSPLGHELAGLSHGEGFLALFNDRFEDGIYLLDEPEAALSPGRQLAFLAVLHRMAHSGAAQLIVATHSPILLSLPGARVLAFDDAGIQEVDYRDTEHFRLTRDFLNAPERYLSRLLADEEEAIDDG